MRKLILLLFIGSIIACAPLRIKRDFTYCFNGNPTGLDTKLKINGLYRGEAITQDGQKLFSDVMFYNDGTYVHDMGALPDDDNKMQDYFNTLGKTGLEMTEKTGCSWGRYIVSSDTIKVQLVVHYSPMDGWSLYEIWYRIIDSQSIVQTFSKPLGHEYSQDYLDSWDKRKRATKYFPLNFIPLKQRPDSTNWLKQQKWTWCKQTM